MNADTTNSYGDVFNKIGGGVYATEWTSDYIRVWFFPHSSIPHDITAGEPDTTSWSLPMASLAGDCDIDNHFQSQQIVFDTTFCGDWAANVWSTDAVCSTKEETCVDYVAKHPTAYNEA